MAFMSRIFCALILLGGKALAYPQFIGFKQVTCMNCHYNPMGNGPLTDYGRGFGASVISSRAFVGKKISDDDLVARSHFPGINPTKNKWLRPMLSYRGLAHRSNAFSAKGNPDPRNSWTNMLQEANVVLKGGERDEYVASFTYGWRPMEEHRPDTNNLMETYGFTREHFIGWKPTKTTGIYAGKLDKVFGLRIPDHVAYSRIVPRINVFTGVHGVMAHAVGEKVEGAVHAFVGDLHQESDLREKGVSGMFEATVAERSRLGASYMQTKTDTLDNIYFAVHNRTGFGQGHSVMAEVGHNGQKHGAKDKPQWGLVQGHFMLDRGFFVMGNLEYMTDGKKTQTDQMRLGPAVQWYPWVGVETRVDLWNTRYTANSMGRKDFWDILAQVHFWL